ncbi:hypothetical protein [Dactylosporangium darangshiense]|uniref:hypothetical protein n=1 Tax=Dactylosporangium darangshiense TaxID=579108 RepID=UPI00363E9CB5
MTIRGKFPARTADTLAILSFVIGAVYVLNELWADPNGRYLALNFQDSFTFEWFLTHATELFTKGETPFFSYDVNYPMGVNLMANTSILTLALPLTPVTLWLGAGVTFAIISTLAVAGTAVAWYWVLSRDFGRSRPAAYVGAAFLGFAPAIMSQLAGHPNIAGQGLIPLIVAAVFRMRHPGRTWRQGLVLAGLVLAQAGINEEMLFFTAMALFVFILAYVPWRDLPGYAKVMLPKCGVTLLVAGAVLAYPLYFQFTGPQAYHGLDSGVRSINLDVLGYTTFGRYSIGGDVAEAVRVNRGNASEENGFFGWPLCLVLVAAAIAMWRSRLSRALFVTAFFFVIMSFGDTLRIDAVEHTDWHGPWHWLALLPLFDSVVPTRLGLVVTAVAGVTIALIIDRLIVDRLRPRSTRPPRCRSRPRSSRPTTRGSTPCPHSSAPARPTASRRRPASTRRRHRPAARPAPPTTSRCPSSARAWCPRSRGSSRSPWRSCRWCRPRSRPPSARRCRRSSPTATGAPSCRPTRSSPSCRAAGSTTSS